MTTSDENLVPDEVPAVPADVAETPPPVAPPVAPTPAATPPVVPPQAPPAATPYAAPPAPPQAYGAPNDHPNTWMNIVAFVTGLLGMAIVPIIFGHLGISAANKGKAEYKWMGIVGAILGYLALAFWVIFIIVIVIASAASVSNS